jgi:hypothetical protein
VRSPQSWAESFSETIGKVMVITDQLPPGMQDWLSMATQVIAKTVFPVGLSGPELAEAFQAHTAAVKAAVPANQLLVYGVMEAWNPLCEFLGLPVGEEPFLAPTAASSSGTASPARRPR